MFQAKFPHHGLLDASNKEATLLQLPTSPKAAGHGENIVFKKSRQDKTPGKKKKEELEILEVKVCDSQRRAFAAGTWPGYENALARYLEFCNYFSLVPFPLSEMVSALFAQF